MLWTLLLLLLTHMHGCRCPGCAALSAPARVSLSLIWRPPKPPPCRCASSAQGADILCADAIGDTPLHIAARHGVVFPTALRRYPLRLGVKDACVAVCCRACPVLAPFSSLPPSLELGLCLC